MKYTIVYKNKLTVTRHVSAVERAELRENSEVVSLEQAGIAPKKVQGKRERSETERAGRRGRSSS